MRPWPIHLGQRTKNAANPKARGDSWGPNGLGDYIFGVSTPSTTWTTPFDCLTSACVTMAVLPP